jgi:2-methylcitrate dehydratase PrpD
MTHSAAIAEFVHSLTLSDIPDQVQAKAKQVFLDIIGIALASSTMDFGRAVTAMARELGGPSVSRLIGSPHKVGAANAVLANGTLAHGLDYDDTLEEAIVHAGCCGVPTALAVGEEVHASGRQVLEAAIAGIEVMSKVGLVAPGKFHARAFHPTGVCAPFAAVAAAGKLYGLDTAQLVNAFGICASQSAGIIEYLADGSWTKRLHPGWAIHGGIIATRLARQGFTGPGAVFEGRHGLYAAFAGHGDHRWERLLELGQKWETPGLAFNSDPCGSISHPYMDCALRLRNEHSLGPAEIDQIDRIVCRTAEGAVHRLWEPLADKRRPQTGYGAKFSLPYSLAVMLVRGKAGLAEFSDDAIHRADVLEVAAKVGYELDPTIDYPRHFVGHVKICFKDGRILEENQRHPRGGAEAPLEPEELEAKFRANAGLVLDNETMERVIALVQRLEELPDVAELSDSLADHPRVSTA